MKVSVVIVNWNTKGPLRRALHSIVPVPGLTWEVFVVDNNSPDGSAAMVRSEFPAVQLIANADNRGFGRACNQAFAKATGDYVLLLNPDAALLPGCISTLISYLEAHPQVGMAGPSLLHDDGAIQYSACREPGLLTEFYEWFGLRGIWPQSKTLGRLYYGYKYDGPMPCDWLVGAVILARKSALDAVGGFDERYWLYAEEMDWCRRFRESGWGVHFVPHARARHTGGQAAAVAPRPMMVEWFRSRMQYHAKFDPQWRQSLLRLTYLTSLALRVAVYRLWAGLDGKRRAAVHRDGAVFWACLRFLAGADATTQRQKLEKVHNAAIAANGR